MADTVDRAENAFDRRQHGIDARHRLAQAAVVVNEFGAVALGDIGRHFPDTDPRYKGADSRVLLRGAVALLAEKGWRPVNVDATLIAQQPKLAPHAAAMVANVAADLGIGVDAVNIKGKTNERLGYLGREEAIEAQAVVLVERVG